MEDLVAPIGRKTANIVLNKMFDVVDGIAVDAHVYRISAHAPESASPLAAGKDLSLLPTSSGKTSTRVDSLWAENLHRSQPKCDRLSHRRHLPSTEQPSRWFKGVVAGAGTRVGRCASAARRLVCAGFLGAHAGSTNKAQHDV